MDSKTTDNKRRILGIPERFVYRIGIFVFYIFLFFAISLATRKIPSPANQVNNKVAPTVVR